MNITWTRKKEWGSEGMTYRADLELGGNSYHFQILSPQAGYWTLTVWKRDGAGVARYLKASTMREAKQLAEDYVIEVESAARTEPVEQLPAALTVRAEVAQPAETVESLRRTEFRQTLAAATELVKAARARVQFRRDTCGCRHPLHTMRCGFGGTVTVVSR